MAEVIVTLDMSDVVVKNDALRQVFGFANVAVKRDGQPMIDTQADEIPVAVLEKAAYDHVANYHECGEMHEDVCAKGRLIESVMITPEKLEAWGIAKDAVAPRWWVGYEIDGETFKKVATGQYRMFSIQGRCSYREVED